jgi:homoserine kinase
MRRSNRAGANESEAPHLLAGSEVDRDRLIDLGTQAEGHPDNVTPCVSGGFAVAVSNGAAVDHISIAPPAGLHAVLAIPAFRLATPDSRGALAQQVTLGDATADHGQATGDAMVRCWTGTGIVSRYQLLELDQTGIRCSSLQ